MKGSTFARKIGNSRQFMQTNSRITSCDGNLSFEALSGSQPTSTSLNTSTGVISGTPTVAGTYTFTIQVTDSLGNAGSQTFSINIAAAASSGSGGAFTFLS